MFFCGKRKKTCLENFFRLKLCNKYLTVILGQNAFLKLRKSGKQMKGIKKKKDENVEKKFQKKKL